MLRHFLLGYIVIYVFIAIGLFALYAFIVPDKEKKNDKPWETPLDLLLALTGLAGMLFLYLNFEPHWLKVVWQLISIGLIVTQIWGNMMARITWDRSRQADDTDDIKEAADITALIFLAPSLILNLYYAFR